MSSIRTASLLTGNAAATSFHDLLRCTCCTPALPSCPGCGVVRLPSMRSAVATHREHTRLQHAAHVCTIMTTVCTTMTTSLAVTHNSRIPAGTLPLHMRLRHAHPLEGRSGGEELVRSDDDPRLRWLSSAGVPPPPPPPACQRGGCCAGVLGTDAALPAAAADAATEADWKGLATTMGLAVFSLETLVQLIRHLQMISAGTGRG
jgi:hypothetical protein